KNPEAEEITRCKKLLDDSSS
nr:Chain A, 20-mer Peptide [synthetic construct]5V2G_B Chain B, 20-mer Peptide [synthetic construct]5V2G_C Chain C, 20-mer Peptide [synthetic construct]